MSAPSPGRRLEVYNAVGGSAFFRRLLREWRAAGFEVAIIESVRDEDYRAPRGFLGRAALRSRIFCGFAGTCWRRARQRDVETSIRVVTTNPFFAPALVARAAAGRGATIALMYDLYPDALVQAGRVRADSAAARLGAAVTRFALRRCAASVYLGERLRAHAERAYGPSRRTAVIPVGADGEPFKDFPPRPLAPTQRPRILYSGLMGQMHDWETLAEAWTGPEGAELAWAFHASGANYARLRAAAGAPADVVWGGPLADQTWQSAMLEASVALITIAPGAETVVMPSKTYSALVAGQAILAICRRDSDLADLVANHDCGWVVEPGDSADLRRVFGEIIRNPATVLAKRRHAFAAGQGRYDMKPVAELWLRLFAELTGSVGADSGGPTRPATLITPR